MGASYMTFSATSGPDRTITAVNSNRKTLAQLGVRRSAKSKRDFQLQRMGSGPNASADMCTVAAVDHSRISGKSEMTVHGRKVVMRQSWEGMRSGKDLDTPVGKFVWRTGGSTLHSVEELSNERTGEKLASCRIPTFGKGNLKLEILAPQDDFLVDMIVASWIILLDD